MKKLTFLTLALSAAVIVNAQQETDSEPQTVTLTLSNKIDIAIEGTPTGNSFTFASAGDYATGIENLNASTFKVRSNQPFNVAVAAAAGTFTASNSSTPMPSTVLGVRLNGSSGAYTALSTAAAALTTGTRGGNNLFSVDYKADPGFNYDAGSYTLSVVYTATQQ